MIVINKIGFAFSCFLVIFGLCKYIMIQLLELLLPLAGLLAAQIARIEIAEEEFILNFTPYRLMTIFIIIAGILLSLLFYLLEKYNN